MPGSQCDENDEDRVCTDEAFLGWCNGTVAMKDKQDFLKLTVSNQKMFRMYGGMTPQIKLMRHMCVCEESENEGHSH